MMPLSRCIRTMTPVALLTVATLLVSCGPKQSQESGEPAASSEPVSAQPHTNGLPPDQFLAEFGAMAYTIDAPWSDGGGNVWGAQAHKQYDGNQLILVLGSNTQSRADQIELNAIVPNGTMSPPMQEAFETGVRTVFAGMDLKIPDAVVAAVQSQSAFEGEAGRFAVQLSRMADPSGGYILSLRMFSR